MKKLILFVILFLTITFSINPTLGQSNTNNSKNLPMEEIQIAAHTFEIIGVLVTIALVGILYKQTTFLRKQNTTLEKQSNHLEEQVKDVKEQIKTSKAFSEADILLRLHNDFFYMNTNKEIVRTIDDETSLQIGEKFKTHEIDDYLGTILLLDNFCKKGLIDIEFIDDMFGYYVVKTAENPEIKEYIKSVQNEEGEIYFKMVFELAEKLKQLDQNKKYKT